MWNAILSKSIVSEVGKSSLVLLNSRISLSMVMVETLEGETRWAMLIVKLTKVKIGRDVTNIMVDGGTNLISVDDGEFNLISGGLGLDVNESVELYLLPKEI